MSETKSQQRQRAAAVLEMQCLVAATGVLLVVLGLWALAVSTDYWFHVLPPAGHPDIYLNRTGTHFVSSHSGLWTICKLIRGANDSEPTQTCHNHRLFPDTESNPEVDKTILDYTRTEMAFSLITFLLILMSFGFSLYTFKQPRYMFKRLAGVLHLISAAAILVVVEVVVNSVHYEESYLNDRHPKGAVWSYGYSFVVAWVAFALLVVSGLTFVVFSRKRKGDQGARDEANILGRM